MKKNCLLIAPPGELDVFPRGIMEIATFLNRNGFAVRVLPLSHFLHRPPVADLSGGFQGDWPEDELQEILVNAIDETDPSIIGISNIYTRDALVCLKIIAICKKLRPNALTVMGGHHATFCDNEILRCSELDVVVRGEGEWVMAALMGALAERRDYRSIQGISYRINGQVRRNPMPPPGRLHEIPPVDFGLLPRKFVQSANIHGILTRGCAYRCRYCVEQNYWGRPRRYRMEKLLTEMETLQRDYRTHMAGLEESMLDMRSKRFYEFCRAIRGHRLELPEQFYITSRIDAVSEEGADQLKSTGIGIICVGIESFSERVLAAMNKKQSPETIRLGCEILQKKHLWTNAYWLIGHPGDNRIEAEHSYGQFKKFFAKGLLKSGHAFTFVPYPGTQFFTNPGKYGIVIGSYDWKRWRRWTESPVSWLQDFSAEEIRNAHNRAWKLISNYRRMNTILYRLGKRIDSSLHTQPGATAAML